MTAGAAPFPPEIVPSSVQPLSEPARRSFWRQVGHDLIRAGGAQAGLGWISILVFAALFAPLLADTQPLLMKMDGHWSVPFLKYLSPTDWELFVVADAIVLVTILRRAKPSIRWGIPLCLIVVAAVPIFAFVRVPLAIDWQHTRDLERAGKVQWKLSAPIPYSPGDFLRDEPDMRLTPPSAQHWLGTDVNGADVASRMLHATRIALSIGLISTGISVIIGITIGGLMGYFSGTVDILGMRLIEIFEAIPTLFLLITFVAFFGRNLYIMMAIIGLTGWTDEARFIRAEFLRLRKQDFVQAAIAAGLPLPSILFRHLLPNGITPILVTSSFGIASAILYESTLSFLGLGLVNEPSWGQMLNQALSVGGTFTWWIAVFPGLAIFL
ncbi:MAG: ABC transporter permease, partial [Phycisphaerae bacterium]|nr:ABC transporter permease [Phycisphaerae bacterium]